jgi:hypothetical protein
MSHLLQQYFCCSLVNLNYLGFILFVCDGNPFFYVLALLSHFGFFGTRLDLSYYPLVCSSPLNVKLDLSF